LVTSFLINVFNSHVPGSYEATARNLSWLAVEVARTPPLSRQAYGVRNDNCGRQSSTNRQIAQGEAHIYSYLAGRMG
jgi:hypothetical protein